MYGKEAGSLLDRGNVGIGDSVKIKTGKSEYSGLVMPRIETGDTNCIILKLSNGYNIGIDSRKIKEMSKMESKKEAPGRNPAKKPSGHKAADPKDEIVILGCGGTIASKIEYKTGAVHPAITSEELVESFPQLKEKKIRTRMLFSLLSENITPQHWIEIAGAIKEEIQKGCKGIVLMHGTDTMHYTSAALSYMIKTPVPIILVGAQRSSDRGSSDNMMNLLSAIMAAESNIAEVMVCMHATENDDYCYLHRGTKVRKMHTSRRDAFKSVNDQPIARVKLDEEKIEMLSPYSARGKNRFEADTKLNTNVALIYVYPGMKKQQMKDALQNHDGAVLIGTGLGHIPSELIDVVKEFSSKKPVAIASQTIYGRLNLNVYETGRNMMNAGVIGHLSDWTPEAAFVKMMFVLAHAKNAGEIKAMMERNLAGEITERQEE